MSKLIQPPRDAITKRLARTIGHLQASLRLIERGRPTADVAQQLHAVEAAIRAAKVQLVREQMEVVLGQAEVQGGTLRKLEALARYF